PSAGSRRRLRRRPGALESRCRRCATLLSPLHSSAGRRSVRQLEGVFFAPFLRLLRALHDSALAVLGDHSLSAHARERANASNGSKSARSSVVRPGKRTRGRGLSDGGAATTAPSGRSAVAIIATDALYGGVAGAVVGAGITLIDNGNNWARNLMLGAGIGILAGAGYGVYEAATQAPPRRAVADANPA